MKFAQWASASRVARAKLPFRKVNQRGTRGHDPAMQRHHLLPKQILSDAKFSGMFDEIGMDSIGFDDFRANGLLLPATERAVLRTGLPLHRGPHRAYSELVAERISQVESDWAHVRKDTKYGAAQTARMRLSLLQRALRKRLIMFSPKPIRLNRKDPLRRDANFQELDQMAEQLWSATEIVKANPEKLPKASFKEL